jgi:hypothetical protein
VPAGAVAACSESGDEGDCLRREGREEILRLHRAFPAIVVTAVALVLTLSMGAWRNQDNKKGEEELRTVHGMVVDKDEKPVPSSIVYLKNLRSQAVTTHIADDSASYKFSGLDPNVDYEIHAEHNDLASPTRTISSFDSRRDLELVLKLSRKKSSP